MAGDTLLRRLETEESEVRARLDRLRREVAQLEEELAHLAITQRTVTKLMADVTRATSPATRGEDGAQCTERARDDTQDSADARPHDGEARGEAAPVPTQRAAAAYRHNPPLGPVSAKIHLLVCSADRPLTPKDVTIALGRDATKRTRIESVRAALEKLASNGHLVKIGPGLFSAPRGSGEGAA